MSTASAGQWVRFFSSAGVPSQASATYAHIFVENRIQTDMLVDLNKEYLREMGITPMGDIIAILRHAKQVNEQTAREKVLSSEIRVPVAAVSANVVSSVVTKANKKTVKATRIPSSSSVRDDETPSPIQDEEIRHEVGLSKPSRRVLPEHEGRYKIFLPSGTTLRSKEILAKQAALYSDRETQRVDIFGRLNVSKSRDETAQEKSRKEKPIEQKVRIVGLEKQATSTSIFARLGDKDEGQEPQDIATIRKKIPGSGGILKNSSTKPNIKLSGGGITKKLPTKQKVILVKKIPAKAATMVADEYARRERIETREKQVSFSSEDEILEISPRRVFIQPEVSTQNQKKMQGNVKNRLGLNNAVQTTRRTIKMKASSPNNKRLIAEKPQQLLNRMKSDELLKKANQPIHSRLYTGSGRRSRSNVSRLVNRIGKANLPNADKRPTSQSGSVFERLGRI